MLKMMKQKSSLLDREISRLHELLVLCEEKIKHYHNNEHLKFAEQKRIDNLHIQIRKLTEIANKEFDVFYCSMCGENCNTFNNRETHVEVIHNEQF